MANWKPSASLTNLRQRAELLEKVRDFFKERGVLEVDTPQLCLTTATDPHLQSIQVNEVFSGDNRDFFLQTSPEFAMKKLLAAGSGSIYQVCKAFRQDERSRRHNPEFTMLEWYRVGFNEQQLMDEVEALVIALTGRKSPARISYGQLFQQQLSLDPHCCTDESLLATARMHVEFNAKGFQRDELLHLLLAQVIEPALEQDCFVYDFPASMAALAAVEEDSSGVKVARRFELFLAGMEIANGYRELVDPLEQQQRFESDNRMRATMNRQQLPVDHDLVAALQHGLPACAGVAVGIDRLLMLACQADSIDEVISFSLDRP